MTNMPEAKLAREAELPFATLAMATDYDCWHSEVEAVTVEQVILTLNKNVANARRAIVALASALPDATTSPAYRALENAIMTSNSAIGTQVRERLGWLIDRYADR